MDNEMTNAETAASQVILTRRQVLQGAAGTGLVLLLPMLQKRVEAATEQWVTVGKATQFPTGQPKRIAMSGGSILFITRQHTANLTAVSAKCTHRGCEVGWNTGDKQFECPCHGAAFASDGKNIHGTRRSPREALPALTRVPVRQQAGQIQVNLQNVPADQLQPRQGRG